MVLTFDVEDWFQVENFRHILPKETWDSQLQGRVIDSTHKILDLLDTIEVSRLRATFFILSWIAKRFPGLVREIAGRGHEIASHGNSHAVTGSLSDNELKNDLDESKNRLEDIIGLPILGYRAPSFSVSSRLIEMLKGVGYVYDSSYNSFSKHGRYGSISLASTKRSGNCYLFANGMIEIPISNINLSKFIIPWGGGGYFRLIPIMFYIAGVKAVLKKEGNFVFYSHPWEFDANQPRIAGGIPISYRFRHYINLHKTKDKLDKLLRAMKDCQLISCDDYIHQVMPDEVIG
jgi:polysaccharide deacetylase family protein (PEP-CTERM system associated)